MKLVVSNKELRQKMQDAVSLLCDTVKTTLGPKGSNVIIDHSTFSPFITNDGVTIAENIESDDVIVNTILELAKEASIKTNEIVGDGTTTTLVLLQSIFNCGLTLIDKGINPILVKRELDEALNEVLEMIKVKSRIPTEKELEYIACVSANDEEIGKNISKAYLKVKNRSSVVIKENESFITTINYLKGYSISSNLASVYFMKDLKNIEYDSVNILLINNYLESLNDISAIVNEMILRKENLVIVASDYSDLVINDVVSLNIDNNINIVLLKNPEYGTKQMSVLKDIEAISNSKIIEKVECANLGDLGIINKINITQEKITFNFKMNENIKKRIKEIKDIINDDFDLEFNNTRIAMFDSGIAEVLVGDKTITERREKKMRYDDALWAINSAIEGVLPGSGIILYKISEEISGENLGNIILKNALKKPFEQIMLNAGLDAHKILDVIKNKDYEVIYDINRNVYESINKTKILDSTNVILNALLSATSIAGMLLTTTSIVINEYKNNINKVNDYNEL